MFTANEIYFEFIQKKQKLIKYDNVNYKFINKNNRYIKILGKINK